MKRIYVIFIAFGILSCRSNPEMSDGEKTGTYRGIFEHGNFSDNIRFEIDSDSANLKVFFTSLEQNANRIPLQNVAVNGDSINKRSES